MAKNPKHCRPRGHRWFYQRAVPNPLRRRVGADVIEVSLGTDSMIVAERRRGVIAAMVERVFARARAGNRIKPAELESLRAVFGRRGSLTAEEVERLEREALHAEHDHLWRDPIQSPDLTRLLAGQSAGNFAPLVAEIERRGRGAELAAAIKADDQDEARDMLKRIGVEASDDAVAKVAEGVAKARARALVYFDHKRDLPPLGDAHARVRAGGRAPKVSEASEVYLAERQRDKSAAMTEQTAAQMRTTFRLFADHVRDARLDELDREDASGFLDALARLHRDYGHRPGAAKLPLAELLRRHPAANGEGLSNKTLNRHQSALLGLFKWARKRGHFSGAAENPFAEMARPKGDNPYLPFTVEELRKLFAGERFEVKPARHTLATARPWVMAVALYSGMRLGFADFNAEDIKRESGVWYFDVTADKTDAGARRVPVHSELVRLGFLDYVRAIGKGPLFPGVKPKGPKDGDKTRSQEFSEHFTAFRRERGVERDNGDRIAFHSFRKCFVRALELAKVDRDRAALVVGHERGFTFRVYNPEGVDMPALREVVEAVKYPGLKLASAKG